MDIETLIQQFKDEAGEEISANMIACQTFPDIIDQCGKTASEHGFHGVHVDEALAACGLSREKYEAFLAYDASQFSSEDELQEFITTYGDCDHEKWMFDVIFRNADSPTVIDGMAMQCYAIKKIADAGIIGDPFIFMALINTECAEACEAIRKDNWTGKDGAWEELADVFIRAFDFVSRYGPAHGVDSRQFLRLIQAKMAKNESRPHLHGKRF